MSMHCYPSYMVPFIGLNPKVNVEELLDNADFAIARRVDEAFNDKDFQRMNDGTYIVRADSSLREKLFERVPNLSMTMLRKAHSLSSAKYDLRMKREDIWKGDKVHPKKYKDKAFLRNTSYLIVHLASNLHGKPAKYQRKFESIKDAKSVEVFYDDLKDAIITNKFSKAKLYDGVGRIYLEHSPNALNYWHFELKLENSEGNIIERAEYKKDENKYNMRQYFVSYVIENYLFKMLWIDQNPCEKDIPLDRFYDSKTSSFKRSCACLMNKLLFKTMPIAE